MSKRVDSRFILLGGTKYAGPNHYMAWMNDGGWVSRKRSGVCFPTIPQSVYIDRLVPKLEREIDHDGAWSIILLAPNGLGIPQSLFAVWHDKDGDIHFTVETERKIDVLIEDGVDYFVGLCEQAFQKWKAFHKEIDIKPHQTRKAAQGEPSVDPKAGPELF